MECPACGRRHGAGDLVCLTCGEPLRAAPGPTPGPIMMVAGAERRPMTALFCDLVNSVGLSEQLDPEDLMAVYDLYRAACETVIARHGGFLAQYLGDGILAYFGFPSADEDDAANAVRAGLDLLERIDALETGLDPPLRARVGIATGLVVVSDNGGRGGGTPGIVGKMPNLAARLQSLAAPGKVVISEATRRVTRGRFTYADLGSVTLKGFSRPVRAWEAMAVSDAESRFQAHLDGAETPFVGRDREADTLAHAWASARAGAGQALLVVGDPGLGKSRLVETFVARTADAPRAQIRWFCSPQHIESPFHPVTDQLRRGAGLGREDSPAAQLDKLARFLGDPDESTLAIFAGLLSIPLGRASPLDAATPERRRELTAAALLESFARVSADAPVVLIVEDIHWIDATSLDLLEQAVRRAAEMSVLVLMTARPEFKPRWTDLPHVSVLPLKRLDPRSAAILCARLAGEALASGVISRILERGDGNPLFVEELTRSVVEALRDAADGGPSGAGDSGVSIPQTLHDSLVARLDRLGPTRRIANIGAALGRRFDYPLLAEVAGQSDGEVVAALKRLLESGIVSQSGAPPRATYLFRHALIRDAAYDSLLRPDRQRLHGQIAAAIRDRFPERAEAEPEGLAYHLGLGGAEFEAVPYWESAAARAASRGAHVEAASHYRAALDIVGRQPADKEMSRRALSIRIPLARSLASSQGYASEAFRDMLTQARDLCEIAGDEFDLYPVLRGLCTFAMVRSDMVVARDLAERCVRIGEQTGHAPYLIEGYNALGFVQFAFGEFQAARESLETCLRLYRDHQGAGLAFPSEQDPKVSSGHMLAGVLFSLGEVVRSAAIAEETLEWARTLGRPFDLAHCLPLIATSVMQRGDFARGETLAREAIELADSHGYRTISLSARMNLGCALGFQGQFQQAIDVLEPALSQWIAEGYLGHTSVVTGQLASFYAAVGRPDAARATIDSAIAHANQYIDLSFLAGLHQYRAGIVGRPPWNDLELAEADLRQAVSVARKQGAVTLERYAQASLQRVQERRASTAA